MFGTLICILRSCSHVVRFIDAPPNGGREPECAIIGSAGVTPGPRRSCIRRGAGGGCYTSVVGRDSLQTQPINLPTNSFRSRRSRTMRRSCETLGSAGTRHNRSCPCRCLQHVLSSAPVFLNAICVVLQLNRDAIVGGRSCPRNPILACYTVALFIAQHSGGQHCILLEMAYPGQRGQRLILKPRNRVG
jgi:hypothetical protein